MQEYIALHSILKLQNYTHVQASLLLKLMIVSRGARKVRERVGKRVERALRAQRKADASSRLKKARGDAFSSSGASQRSQSSYVHGRALEACKISSCLAGSKLASQGSFHFICLPSSSRAIDLRASKQASSPRLFSRTPT